MASHRPLIATIFAALLGCAMLPADSSAAQLKPEAAQGFDRYVQRVVQRMQMEGSSAASFPWLGRLPNARREDVFSRLRRGEVVTERIATPDGDDRASSDDTRLPGALIHHWIGTVFIPRASLQEALALLQDYDNHQKYYAPQVVRSKTLSHSDGSYRVYLRLARTKIVTVVLDTEYDVQYRQLDSLRAQSSSYSTRIAEVESPGEPDERQMSPGDDHGFLWRLDSFWRYQEADGGVYVQCEAISLTRDIPTGLNWFVAPFVESVPRESLEFTLQTTRAAVLGHLTQSPAGSK